MQTATCYSRILSVLLTGIFLFTLLLPAAASETAEETLPLETIATEPSVPETTAAQTEETVFETTVPTEPAETEPVQTVPSETEAGIFAAEEAAFSSPYNLYFGLLHAHTNISDGLGSVEEAFSHAADVEGLDFFAVTDHSNSFDNADVGGITLDGCALSTEWAEGKAAAAAVTDEDFLGLFGYEMTWPEIRQLGHITTFGTPGWISRDQAGFADDADALEHYFRALAAVPGSVSQFCHPGKLYGDFDRFGHYRPEYDDSVQLLETLGEGSVEAYILALDNFWHLAPTASQNNHNRRWGDENDLRTVVLAEALTEESLFEAIRSHRVYATEDKDLHISYTLDGHIMGSVLSDADSLEILLTLYDPTDPGSCTVEVIAEGGITLASCQTEGDAQVRIPVPGGYRWYFLRLTQSDGDIAVTAPVWVEGFGDMGIEAFTADTQMPIQGKPMTLELKLFNRETVDFSLTSLEFYAGETLIHSVQTPGTVPAGEELCYCFSYTHTEPGTQNFRAVARGTVLGRERTYEGVLSLRFRPEQTVTGALIDGSHGNAGRDLLERLKALLQKAGLDVTEFPGDMPLGGIILVIPPLQTDPEEGFWEDILHFLESGGSLILWGGSGDNSRENRLLEAIGATLRLTGEKIPEGSAAVFNRDAPWCTGLVEDQYFRHPEGFALEPGSGSWLVKDGSGQQVLLACEQVAGGRIFVAGCPFLTDEILGQSQSRWDLPTANETILQTILGGETELLEQEPIRQVRSGVPGEVYRIRGYVTAGTSNPYTTFRDTIYIQDSTGGIAVTGAPIPELQIGTPVELIGTLEIVNGNPTLVYADHRLPQEAFHRYAPRTMACKTATDYDAHGGELVQVEGTVTALTLTADRKGIVRLVVKDVRGNSAVIEIEDAIRSGATGRNTLAKEIKKGRTVRCMGLLHINAEGKTVLRVRNCDEVVYLPPEADPTNPKTADRLWWFL